MTKTGKGTIRDWLTKTTSNITNSALNSLMERQADLTKNLSKMAVLVRWQVTLQNVLQTSLLKDSFTTLTSWALCVLTWAHRQDLASCAPLLWSAGCLCFSTTWFSCVPATWTTNTMSSSSTCHGRHATTTKWLGLGYLVLLLLWSVLRCCLLEVIRRSFNSLSRDGWRCRQQCWAWQPCGRPTSWPAAAAGSSVCCWPYCGGCWSGASLTSFLPNSICSSGQSLMFVVWTTLYRFCQIFSVSTLAHPQATALLIYFTQCF